MYCALINDYYIRGLVNLYAKLRHIKAVVTEVNFSTSSVKLAFNAIEYITKKPKCGFSEGKYIKKIKTR